MTRRFPGGDTRLAFQPGALGAPLLGQSGQGATIYTSATGSTVATGLTLLDGTPITGGRVLIGADGLWPEFDDSTDRVVLFGQLDGSTRRVPLYAQTEALVARVATAIKDASAVTGRISVASYGAVGDGTTNNTAALQAAVAASTGKTLVVPEGVFLYDQPLDLPSPMRLEFASRNAVLKYVGSGDAVRIRNRKNVDIISGCLDLSASPDASVVGLHIAGLWFSLIVGLKIVQGPASSTGVLIETSGPGQTDWGAYIICLRGLDLQVGAGAYGVRTLRTTGDTVGVTHLDIDGGWCLGKGFGLHLERCSSGRVDGTALELGGNDGIRLVDSFDMHLSPGEIGRFSGYAINPFGTGNSAITVVASSQAGSNTLGFLNTSSHNPTVLQQGLLRVRGSRTDEAYWTELESLFNAAKAMRLRVRGGGANSFEVLTWSDGDGLLLSGGQTRGTQIEQFGGRVGFFGKSPKAAKGTLPAAATDAATTQSLVNAIRVQLINLGLTD